MPMQTIGRRLAAVTALTAFAALAAGCGAHMPHQQAQAAAPATAAATPGAATTTVAAAETGRDWTRIDTDRDNNVSPAEMEAWLKANPGPLAR